MAQFIFQHGKSLSLSGDIDEISGFKRFYCLIQNLGGNIVYANNNKDLSDEKATKIKSYSASIVPVDNVRNRLFISGNGTVVVYGFDTLFEANATLLLITAYYAKNGDNLLVNPDFRINQRGNSVYSAAGFTCDMWELDHNGSVSLVTGGITLGSSENAPTWFYQRFENPFMLDGKAVTLSICDESGIVYSASGNVPEGSLSQSKCIIDLGFCGVRGQLWKRDDNILLTQIAVPAGMEVSIKWIKLELGNVATPFMPPDSATEVIKCQRYYQIRSTNDIDLFDLRPSMAQINSINRRADGYYEYCAF